MNPKFRLSLQRANRNLALTSRKRYTGLLCSLVAEYRHLEELAPILNKIEGSVRNWDLISLLDAADSLAAQSYATATLHFVANQFSLLIRKYPFPPSETGIDAEQRAKLSFHAGEASCALANVRIMSDQSSYSDERQRARAFIRRVLGSTPDMLRIASEAGFTPGANVGVHGSATNIARKLASDWTVSRGALDYAWYVIRGIPAVMEVLYERSPDGRYAVYDDSFAKEKFLERVRVCDYNKIAFVPKTVRTHRSIAVEPFLNSFLQKGVDIVMRSLILKRTGIDLRDQELNQRMAREGCADSDDDFVTIDLKNASNSVSKGVVADLVPDDWRYLLNRLRSHSYSMDGTLKEYSMFCSMGNGFCFPLETLVFMAICHAAGAGDPVRDYSVYGDDIIVRKCHSAKVIELLAYFGFETNADKTFLCGPFRESCGADWFGGEDVRPFTLDYALDSVENIFKFLNLSTRNERCEAFFSGVRKSIVDSLPTEFRLCRPFSGNADAGYEVPLDEFMSSPNARWSSDYQRWNWRELVHEGVPDKEARYLRNGRNSLLIAALLGSRSKAPFTVRRKVQTSLRWVLPRR